MLVGQPPQILVDVAVGAPRRDQGRHPAHQANVQTVQFMDVRVPEPSVATQKPRNDGARACPGTAEDVMSPLARRLAAGCGGTFVRGVRLGENPPSAPASIPLWCAA